MQENEQRVRQSQVSPPPFVDVSSIRYTIKVTNEDSLLQGDDRVMEAGMSGMGYTDHRFGSIMLREAPTTCSYSQQRDTLLHEVLHGVLTVTGLSLKAKLEEDIINRMTPILLDTLRSNRWLTDYLLAEEDIW